MALNVHIIECDIDPNVAPTAIGQHWVNTTSGEMWFSKGTSGVGDWVKLEGDTDIKTKVSANDTTAGFLNGKLVQGANITLTENNDGGNETLTIAATQPADQNLFETISTPLGTSPVADTTTDTLTLTSGDNSVSITGTAATDTVDFQVNEANVDHDALSNFVANEHIDWTAASAGTIDPTNYVDNDEKVKVSSNDTTPSDLITKLQAGTNVTIVENNDGGNETVTISATGTLTSDCPAVQARRTTTYAMTTSYVDLTLDSTDLETTPSTLEHDNTNTDRILIKETGLYKLQFTFAVNSTSSGMACGRFRVNDATVIAGSEMCNQDGNDENIVTNEVLASLSANDFVSFQVKKTAGTHDIVRDTVVTVIKCAGAKGDKGDTGSGSNVIVKDEGTNIPNTPHTDLNFVGTGVTVTDGGAGVATITIPGSTNIFGSQFHSGNSASESSTTSSTFQQKLRLTTGSLPTGNYRIGWYFEHKGSGSSEGRVELNDTTTLAQVDIDSSTPDFLGQSGHYYTGSISGVQNIDIDWRAVSSTAYIRRARLEIWRIS